jgi:hypothetical protein
MAEWPRDTAILMELGLESQRQHVTTVAQAAIFDVETIKDIFREGVDPAGRGIAVRTMVLSAQAQASASW